MRSNARQQHLHSNDATGGGNQSAWRIKASCKKGAASCDECTAFWDKLLDDKEDHIEELEKLVKRIVDALPFVAFTNDP
jgi:hypothetical protein